MMTAEMAVFQRFPKVYRELTKLYTRKDLENDLARTWYEIRDVTHSLSRRQIAGLSRASLLEV